MRARGKRRAHDHLKKPALSECPSCHEYRLPHRVCPHCGQYHGREVIEVAETVAATDEPLAKLW